MEKIVYYYKIILVGESGVGKTCLAQRYTKGKFEFNPSSIGVDYYPHGINIDGDSIEMQIWDTAGSEKYRSLVQTYYRGALGALVVFDLNSPITFEKVTFWIDSIREANENKTDIILVGNKSDLDIDVDYNKINEIKNKYQIEYFDTSAKDNLNVNEVFESLAKKIHTRNPFEYPISVPKPNDGGKSCC